MYCHIHHCHYHHCNCVPKDSKENGKALTQEELLAYTQEMKEELKDYTVDLKDQIFSYIDIGVNPVEIANTFASLKEQDTYILRTLTHTIDELNNTTNLSMFNLRTRVTNLEGQSASIISDLVDRTQRIDELETNTQVLESVSNLSSIENPKDGLRVYVKSYHAGGLIGGSEFIWDVDCNKSKANGGTIIDPDGLSTYNGTHNTLKAFLDTQGLGSGTGCWVALDDTLDITRFGAVYSSYDPITSEWIGVRGVDVSPALQKCFDVASSTGYKNGVIRLPSGYMELHNKVSLNRGGSQYAFILEGEGTQTTLKSSVINDTSLEFNNASNITLRGFTLHGFGSSSSSQNNGHGVAFNSVDVGNGYSQYPNNCKLDDITVRGFNGTGLVSSGQFNLPAAGVFIDKGVVNTIDKCSIWDNSIGVLCYKSQQASVMNSTVWSNDFSNIIFLETIDICTISNSNVIGITNCTRKEQVPYGYTGNAEIPASGIILLNCNSKVTIDKIKAKGEARHIYSLENSSVTVRDSWFRVPVTGYPAITNTSGAYKNPGFICTGNMFEGSYITADIKSNLNSKYPDNDFDFSQKAVMNTTLNGGRGIINVELNSFELQDKWDYLLLLNNSTTTHVSRATFCKNVITNRDGSDYDSGVESIVSLVRGTGKLHLEGNSFEIHSRNGHRNYINNILTTSQLNSAAPSAFIVNNNDYRVLESKSSYPNSVAEIVNKALPDQSIGTATNLTPYSSNAYNLGDLTRLNQPVAYSDIKVLKAMDSESDITHNIKAVMLYTKSNSVYFKLYRTDTDAPYTGAVTVRWFASTGAREDTEHTSYS